MRIVLFTAAAILLGYCGVTLLYSHFSAGNAVLVALAIPLLIWGLFYGTLTPWARAGWGAALLFCLRAGYAAVALCVAICASLMIGAGARRAEPGREAVIVLGAGLRGTAVSQALALRLDAALAYLQENPTALCVLSGGWGEGAALSEAEAMSRYLVERGVSPERLLPEDRSRNTAQNIAFSRQVLTDALGRAPGPVVVATSDYHVFRGVALARGAGLDAQGVASPSRPILLPVYALRETVGILKDALLGRL